VDKVKHLKTLQLREQQRKTFRHIKAINNNLQYGGLTYLIDSDGKECTDWESIEVACLQENQARFNQASDTPFLQELLYSLVGNYGEGPGSSSILDGTFDIPGISAELKDILKALHTCCLEMDQLFPNPNPNNGKQGLML